MPNKAECDEYVLEEFGIIFAGNKNRINSFGWNFGQVNAALKCQTVLAALVFTWTGWRGLVCFFQFITYASEEQESGIEIRTHAKPCYTD